MPASRAAATNPQMEKLMRIPRVAFAFAVALGALSLDSEVSAQAQQPFCSPPTEFSELRAQRLASAPSLDWARKKFGLVGVETAEVRLLSNDRDAETCRKLHAALQPIMARDRAPRGVTYYQVGNYYFVPTSSATRPVGNGRIHTSNSVLYVVDRQFKVFLPASM